MLKSYIIKTLTMSFLLSAINFTASWSGVLLLESSRFRFAFPFFTKVITEVYEFAFTARCKGDWLLKMENWIYYIGYKLLNFSYLKFVKFGSAPWSSNTSIHSECPPSEAMCNVVFPFSIFLSSLQFTLFDCRIIFRHSVCPNSAAKKSGDISPSFPSW